MISVEEAILEIGTYSKRVSKELTPYLEEREQWYQLVDYIDQATTTMRNRLSVHNTEQAVAFVTGNSGNFAKLLLKISGINYAEVCQLNHDENRAFYDFDTSADNPWDKVQRYNTEGKKVHIIDDYTSGGNGKSKVLSNALDIVGNNNLACFFITRDNPQRPENIVYGLEDSKAYHTIGELVSVYAEFERLSNSHPPKLSTEYYYDPIPVEELPRSTIHNLKAAHRVVTRIAEHFGIEGY